MEVICSGMNVVDVFVKEPSKVLYGGKTQCDNIMIQGGAPAGNTACGLASLGHETAFLGYFSDSTLSSIAKHELLRNNVRSDMFINRHGAQPAMSIVQVDSKGERTVLYSTNGYTTVNPNDFDESQLSNCKLIVVDGYDYIINTHLLKLAKAKNIESVLDMEHGDKNVMFNMVKLASHSVLPLEAAKFMTGCNNIEDCVIELSKLTEGQIVVTDGINGSYAMDENEVIHQPAFKVNAIDTTGCGDAFHAGYASALIQGFDLKKRLEYGAMFAAQVATHIGGRTSFPSRKQMKELLK